MVPGSHCDHLLISLPYPHGPDLEHCPLPDGHARILRALPVTAAETAYRREHGHNALERLFDEHAIVPTDPRRPSVARTSRGTFRAQAASASGTVRGPVTAIRRSLVQP